MSDQLSTTDGDIAQSWTGDGSQAPSLTPDSIVTGLSTYAVPTSVVLQGDLRTVWRYVPEVTLAIVKPDGVRHFRYIKRRIKSEGFQIVKARQLMLTHEQACEFYKKHFGQPYFPLMVCRLCEGPIIVLVLSRPRDCVDYWKFICGPACVDVAKAEWPDSLRARLGEPGEDISEVVHASETKEIAMEEIQFFFPDVKWEANMTDSQSVWHYLREFLYPTLQTGLVEICKSKPLDPVMSLGEWLLANNPNKPKMSQCQN